MKVFEPILETSEGIMAESMAGTTVSRRSTRLLPVEVELMVTGLTGQAERESRQVSEEKDQEKIQKEQKRSVAPANSSDLPTVPWTNFGMDLSGNFPSTLEGMNEQVSESFSTLKADKGRGEGRPVNFGTVLPKAIYRSSFPMVEDFHFLGTLGLKTVISLVEKDFPVEFKEFMTKNGIRHIVVDMQGTKKVEIPNTIMQSIMEVALNKAYHPLLIHCNHGRHRTGCAVAVIRHVAGWTVDSITQEYKSFAEPKIRECDLAYIEAYKVSSLQGLFMDRLPKTSPALTTAKMLKFVIGTVLAILVCYTTISFWKKHH